jgi:hypothetical protein
MHLELGMPQVVEHLLSKHQFLAGHC